MRSFFAENKAGSLLQILPELPPPNHDLQLFPTARRFSANCSRGLKNFFASYFHCLENGSLISLATLNFFYLINKKIIRTVLLSGSRKT